VERIGETNGGRFLMHTFEVYHHIEKGHEAVKKGFSWPGFFFGAIWAFVKGLPGIGVVLIIVALVLRVFEAGAGSNPGGMFFVVILYLAVPLVVGFQGNDWRRSKLTEGGYKLATTVEAEDPDAAIAAVTGNSTAGAHTTAKEPSKDPKWSTANDDLTEAVIQSNTHPQIAVDKIKTILTKGVNINAKNESGRTALSIANYYEVPSVVRTLLVNAGAEE